MDRFQRTGPSWPSNKWPTMTTDPVRAGITEKRLFLRLAEKCFLAKNNTRAVWLTRNSPGCAVIYIPGHFRIWTFMYKIRSQNYGTEFFQFHPTSFHSCSQVRVISIQLVSASLHNILPLSNSRSRILELNLFIPFLILNFGTQFSSPPSSSQNLGMESSIPVRVIELLKVILWGVRSTLGTPNQRLTIAICCVDPNPQSCQENVKACTPQNPCVCVDIRT